MGPFISIHHHIRRKVNYKKNLNHYGYWWEWTNASLNMKEHQQLVKWKDCAYHGSQILVEMNQCWPKHERTSAIDQMKRLCLPWITDTGRNEQMLAERDKASWNMKQHQELIKQKILLTQENLRRGSVSREVGAGQKITKCTHVSCTHNMAQGIQWKTALNNS